MTNTDMESSSQTSFLERFFTESDVRVLGTKEFAQGLLDEEVLTSANSKGQMTWMTSDQFVSYGESIALDPELIDRLTRNTFNILAVVAAKDLADDVSPDCFLKIKSAQIVQMLLNSLEQPVFNIFYSGSDRVYGFTYDYLLDRANGFEKACTRRNTPITNLELDKLQRTFADLQDWQIAHINEELASTNWVSQADIVRVRKNGEWVHCLMVTPRNALAVHEDIDRLLLRLDELGERIMPAFQNEPLLTTLELRGLPETARNVIPLNGVVNKTDGRGHGL